MDEEIPMKESRFTEAQIMGVLRQAEGGMPVPELCRAHGFSSATFYKWRAKYLRGQEAASTALQRGVLPPGLTPSKKGR
jgi:putative transposase